MAEIDIDGGVPATTLNGSITSGATSITVTDGTGYPSGAGGNFYVVVDLGEAAEETIECSATSGNVLTVATRGADGTSAAAHNSGATVAHCVPALTLQEANTHANQTTGTPHGSAYLTTTTHASISHDASMLAAGSVDTSELAADAVDGTKIADNSIDSEHYVDGSIDAVHLVADIIDGTKLADNAVDSEHYTDGSIDTAHIALDAINGTLIADDSIDSEHYVDASIDTAHLADDAVTNDKVGFTAPAPASLTVTQGATLTFSTEQVRHMDLGNISVMFGYLVFSSAGTASNRVLLTLPTGLTGSASYAQGSAHFNDSSGGAYSLHVRGESSTNDTIRFQGEDGSGNGILGTDIAVTVASGDTLNFFVMWRNA